MLDARVGASWELDREFGSDTDICFIVTSMGRLDHVKRSLSRVVAQPDVSVVVVDFSCPEGTGDWVEANFDPAQVRVVRVPGQARWNPAIARNRGARIVGSEWLFLLDADSLVEPDFVERMRIRLRPGSFYVALDKAVAPAPTESSLGRKGLFGFIACETGSFRAVRGYDPVIEGWGMEDTDLRLRLALAGFRQQIIDPRMLQSIQHPDALRVVNHDVKDKLLSNLTNTVYCQVKLDLMRLKRGMIPAEHRRFLYRTVKQRLYELLQGPQRRRGRVELVFDTVTLPVWKGTMNKVLRYEILVGKRFSAEDLAALWSPTERELPPVAFSEADETGIEAIPRPLGVPPLETALEQIRRRFPELASSARERPVFVLSAGHRSGSTLLQRMLVGQCLIWGEPYGMTGLIDHLVAPFRHLNVEDIPAEFYESDAGFEGGLKHKWIANLYPAPQALLNAAVASMRAMFAEPAAARGYRRWGLKEVRLGVDHAMFLKWLFPQARFLFIYRNPFHAYASYRQFRRAWYLRWPDRPLDSAALFGAHWARLAEQFVKSAHLVGGQVIRFEELIEPGFDPEPLAGYLGFPVDLDARDVRLGRGSEAQRAWQPPDPSEFNELEAVVGEMCDRLDYARPENF